MNSIGHILTRRRFLHLSAAAGLAAMTLPRAIRAAPDVGPFHRTGRPRLRLSLSAYSFRRFFTVVRGKPNPNVPPGKATDLFQFIDYCAAHGCEGTELTGYFFAAETEDYLLSLRRHSFLRGMAVSGTAIGNNFSHPMGPKRDEEIATAKRWIDHAVLLGAPYLRVFAGKVPDGFPRAEADKMVISALEECCDYAGRKGVFLGLENHDSIGSADALLPIVKTVKSPWLGVNLDSGNFRTDDPYVDFAQCVPYAINVQFKVHDVGGYKREADFGRLTQLLRDGGYQGWVALEYEAEEDPLVAVPRHLRQMQELFA